MPPKPRPRAALAMLSDLPERIFEPAALARLRELVDLDPTPDPELTGAHEDVEVLITGWGCARITPQVLTRMPSLRAVLHAAGSVKGHLDRAVWERGILVTTAANVNALPVAEYTLAMILLSGKGYPTISRPDVHGSHLDAVADRPTIGNFRRRVGLVGASLIGRRVIELLAPFDLEVLLSDPFLDPGDPILAHARLVDLPTLFAGSDVVSVHAPLLPETVGMIDAGLLASMPADATLINTARAPIVDQEALTEAVLAGRLRAVLDVTDPEPLPADHPLHGHPGAVVTPHVAGALGNEMFRFGGQVLAEVERIVTGQEAAQPVAADRLAAMA